MGIVLLHAPLRLPSSVEVPALIQKPISSIVDAVDGILAPYRIASADYNAEIFPHQLSTTREALAGKRLYAVQYGGQWGVETVASVLAEQVEVAGAYADGVLLFNFPLQMFAAGAQQGLFGEKASPNDNFTFFEMTIAQILY